MSTLGKVPWSFLPFHSFILLLLQKEDRASNRTELRNVLDPNLWKVYLSPAGLNLVTVSICHEKRRARCCWCKSASSKGEGTHHMHHPPTPEHNPSQLDGRSNPSEYN
jgi:hypothetical protein